MGYKKILFIFTVILIALGIYYRDYIPTTRSDVENLYYFFTEKKASNFTGYTEPSVGSGLNSEPENSAVLEGQNTETNGSERRPKPTPKEIESVENNNISNDSQEKITTLPNSTNNYVPFISQAPHGVWDKLHDAACEEASLAMAHYYLDKRDVVFSKEAEKDIQYIASKTKGGGIPDLNVEEVNAAATNLYGYKNWRIIDKPTVQDIKKELSEGNIIIIPLAGREIGNPYYRQPGPLYHMLVINGYDDKNGVFITQDPGTKRGKDFTYKFGTLLKANHDFHGDKDKIKEGPARILVVVKQK